MRRAAGWYVGVGIALYLTFLIVHIPANWLAWMVARTSNNALTLHSVSGTLWRGAGDLTFVRPGNATHRLGTGGWSINPFAFFLGRLSVDVRFTEPSSAVRGRVEVALRGVTLKDVEIQFPAARIPSMYPAAALVNPSGELHASTTRFVWARSEFAGEFLVRWLNAGTNISNLNPLGSYRVTAQGQGAVIGIGVSTDAGKLVLNGQGTWSIKTRRLVFKGTATPTAESMQALAPVLEMMGRDQGNGQRSFSIDVSL